MFHNDILTADGIRGVVAPVKNLWRWHGRVGLDWTAREISVTKPLTGGFILTVRDSGHFRIGGQPSWSCHGSG